MIRNIAIIFIILNVLLKSSFGYDNIKTHPDLTGDAVRRSILGTSNLLKDMGWIDGIDHNANGMKLWDWAGLGAELEDAGSDFDAIIGQARFKNHFHNPLEGWSEAGLSDVQNGLSMVLWAQDSSSQQGATEGDWSWQTLRTHYLKALTAETEVEREEYLAKTFRGLGHQMHLIQDAGQPDHVRNDAHPMDGKGLRLHIGYEKWTKEQRGYIRSLASNPAFPQVSMNRSPENGLAPVARLIDANLYTGTVPMAGTIQGLAEYANSNFFSDDTIFAAERFSPGDKHYFPYPKASSTNLREYVDGTIVPEKKTALDGTDEYGIWIKKEWDGEIVNHLVRPSFFSKIVLKTLGEENLFYATFYRDEICHIDYAQKLIPRAVGYSAALIDYFFRGKIDMVADPNNPGQYVIKNESAEDMSGTFRLYYDDTSGNRKSVSDTKWDLSIPANGTSTPVTFSAPTDAKEAGRYMLVFQGSLGAEEGAVVGESVQVQSAPKVRIVTVSNYWANRGHINVFSDEKVINTTIPAEGISQINSVRFDVNDWDTFAVMATHINDNCQDGCVVFHEFNIDEDKLEVRYGGILHSEKNLIHYNVEEIYRYIWPDTAREASRIRDGVKEYSIGEGFKINLHTDNREIRNYVDFFFADGKVKPFGTINKKSSSWLSCRYNSVWEGDEWYGGWGDSYSPMLEDKRKVTLHYGDDMIELINSDCSGGSFYLAAEPSYPIITGCQPQAHNNANILPIAIFNENDYAYATYKKGILENVSTTLPLHMPQTLKNNQYIKTMLSENGKYSFYTRRAVWNESVPLKSFSSEMGILDCGANLIGKNTAGEKYIGWNAGNGLISISSCSDVTQFGVANVYISDDSVFDIFIK